MSTSITKRNGGLRQQKSFVAGILLVVTLSALSLSSKSKFDLSDGLYQRQLRSEEEIVDGDDVPVDINSAIDSLVRMKDVLGETMDAESLHAFDAEIRSLMTHQEALQDLQAYQHSRRIDNEEEDRCDDICEGKLEIVRKTKEDIDDVQATNREVNKAARKAVRVLEIKEARVEERKDERRRDKREIQVRIRAEARVAGAGESAAAQTAAHAQETARSAAGAAKAAAADAQKVLDDLAAQVVEDEEEIKAAEDAAAALVEEQEKAEKKVADAAAAQEAAENKAQKERADAAKEAADAEEEKALADAAAAQEDLDAMNEQGEADAAAAAAAQAEKDMWESFLKEIEE